MNEFKIKDYEYMFRIKDMNAIEALALRAQISNDSFEKTVHFFNLVLEHIEVEFNGKWMPVKTKDMEVYYPAGIERNMNAIQELIEHFTVDFLKPLFTSSNASDR